MSGASLLTHLSAFFLFEPFTPRNAIGKKTRKKDMKVTPKPEHQKREKKEKKKTRAAKKKKKSKKLSERVYPSRPFVSQELVDRFMREKS